MTANTESAAILTDERIESEFAKVYYSPKGPGNSLLQRVYPHELVKVVRRLEADLRAALAAVPGSEPVAYIVDWHDIGEGASKSLYYETGAKQHMESAVSYAKNVRNRPSTVTPLYAKPSPVAAPVVLVDRNADIERAAVICEGFCASDDSDTQEAINEILCQRASRIRGLKSAAPASPTATLQAQLAAMRSAFHVNMLRAYPERSHAEIAAEIDKVLGIAPAVQDAPSDIRELVIDVLSAHRMVHMYEAEDEGILCRRCDLIDRLSLKGERSAESGQSEIAAIADAIVGALAGQVAVAAPVSGEAVRPDLATATLQIHTLAGSIKRKAGEACAWSYEQVGAANTPDGLLEDIASLASGIEKLALPAPQAPDQTTGDKQ